MNVCNYHPTKKTEHHKGSFCKTIRIKCPYLIDKAILNTCGDSMIIYRVYVLAECLFHLNYQNNGYNNEMPIQNCSLFFLNRGINVIIDLYYSKNPPPVVYIYIKTHTHCIYHYRDTVFHFKMPYELKSLVSRFTSSWDLISRIFSFKIFKSFPQNIVIFSIIPSFFKNQDSIMSMNIF